MAQIILDMGSGATTRNDTAVVKEMIDAIKKIDTGKHEVVFKTQLFENLPPNVPLRREVFDYAYTYAAAVGYKCTSSVFDKPSLEFLLTYDVPFIKIANRADMRWLGEEVPRKIPVYASYSPSEFKMLGCASYFSSELLYKTPCTYGCDFKRFVCVSEYPAKYWKYKTFLRYRVYIVGISDHTRGLRLWYKYQPRRWEKHLKLPESTGPDAGSFAILPDELKEIL